MKFRSAFFLPAALLVLAPAAHDLSEIVISGDEQVRALVGGALDVVAHPCCPGSHGPLQQVLADLGLRAAVTAALDLNDRDLRLAKELGYRIVMSSDSHDSRNLGKMVYGAKQLRRAWLTKDDVLNTREAKGFLAGLRAKP